MSAGTRAGWFLSQIFSTELVLLDCLFGRVWIVAAWRARHRLAGRGANAAREIDARERRRHGENPHRAVMGQLARGIPADEQARAEGRGARGELLDRGVEAHEAAAQARRCSEERLTFNDGPKTTAYRDE